MDKWCIDGLNRLGAIVRIKYEILSRKITKDAHNKTKKTMGEMVGLSEERHQKRRGRRRWKEELRQLRQREKREIESEYERERGGRGR